MPRIARARHEGYVLVVVHPGPAAPAVTSESPGRGALGVARTTAAAATFSEAVQSSTISFTFTPSGGSPVAASVSYNSSTDTVTLTPGRPGLHDQLHRDGRRGQGRRATPWPRPSPGPSSPPPRRRLP